jgi:glycerate 2-kinase
MRGRAEAESMPAHRIDSPEGSAREFLVRLYEAALRRVDPNLLVPEALGRRGDALVVRSVSSARRREFVFVPSRLAILSLGKAAASMAACADEILGDRVATGIVIVPNGTPAVPLPTRYRVIEASHPQPDERSLFAGQVALSLASHLGKDDLLLVLLSGGGSSLMAAPADGLTLEDKARTIGLLMAAGAPIKDVNLVRGALSRVKGGRLSEAAGAADVVTLVLSDLGDEGWHLVASGPTLGLPPSPREAFEIFHRYRITPLVPPPVRSFLERPVPGRAPRPLGQRFSVLLADIRSALEGAQQEALRLGAEVRMMPELLSGEARSAGPRLALAAASAGRLSRRPEPSHRRLVTLFGGETTVGVKGPGRGGRNRELALAAAHQIAGLNGACILCAGTDGIDHEPDAAGAFVDDTTLERAEELGLDPARALLDNDTGPFFERLKDAFSPGATGTNVGDVAFVLAPVEPPGDPSEPTEPAEPKE